MYNLSNKQFKPSIIFISIIFFPIFFGLIAVLTFNFDIFIFVVFLFVLLFYILLIMLYKKISNNKNHYLVIHEEMMEIHYSNGKKISQSLTINYNEIIKIEYFRMSSIISWLQVINGVVPKCVYVTYTKFGKEDCELIGYMDLKDIKKLTNDKKIKLIVK